MRNKIVSFQSTAADHFIFGCCCCSSAHQFTCAPNEVLSVILFLFFFLWNFWKFLRTHFRRSSIRLIFTVCRNVWNADFVCKFYYWKCYFYFFYFFGKYFFFLSTSSSSSSSLGFVSLVDFMHRNVWRSRAIVTTLTILVWLVANESVVLRWREVRNLAINIDEIQIDGVVKSRIWKRLFKYNLGVTDRIWNREYIPSPGCYTADGWKSFVCICSVYVAAVSIMITTVLYIEEMNFTFCTVWN